MIFRYKLHPFGAADTPDGLLAKVYSVAADSGAMLSDGSPKRPWNSVFDHLRALGARSLLVQSDVRDPDFLEEHRAFYSKQHRHIPSMCVRVHAFACDAPPPPAGAELDILSFLDAAVANPSLYLGFVTVRPLRHAPVGVSILAPLAARRPAATESFPVHIAGNDFVVIGTPFLQQDNAVGACAQASIWMALRTLRKRVGNAAYSPAELTMAATRYLASDRTFPGRQGLTSEQMLEAVRSAGHDPLYFDIRVGPGYPTANAVISKVHPYVSSGLPVILILRPPSGGHAVVAIGANSSAARVQPLQRQNQHLNVIVSYSLASDWTSEFIIHNDNTGPYLSLVSGNPGAGGYCLEHAHSAIVPLPDGVYTDAAEAEILAVRAMLLGSIWFTAPTGKVMLPQVGYVLRPYLCTRHAFRTWAKNDPDLDAAARDVYRTCSLPRELWVVEIHEEDQYDPTDPTKKSRCGEVVLDPAADALHGDALLAVRLTNHLWPGVKSFQALLLVEDGSLQSLALTTGNRMAALIEPWKH